MCGASPTRTMLNPEFLADQLERTFAADPWYGPDTRSLLAGLTPEQAARRTVEHGHSIWEIVLHMTSWQEEVRERLNGKVPTLPQRGDWPAPAEATAEAWADAGRALESTLQELASAVRQLEPDELLAPVGDTKDRPLGTGVTCLDMLVGVLQHNAYHSGQIALLVKAQQTAR